MENQLPIISQVLTVVNNDSNLTNFSLRTLYRLVKNIGFVFSKINLTSLLIEHNDIICWSHSYLRHSIKYREEGRKIVYLDETWMHVSHTCNKLWKGVMIKTPKDAFLAGLSSGLKTVSKGPLFVVANAGSDEGFLEGRDLVFLAKKSSTDYHNEMQSSHFEKCMIDNILSVVFEGSVIDLDNRPYHSRKKRFPLLLERGSTLRNGLH
ncbi:uncharacterized protein LOC142317893 [Lycorma delicatula]|uniref:uncharacterized protein LOC142317893 n=1 Tax=Lycorma delicatula TaxID=130591 RepID=UPI003F512E96